MIEHLVLFRVRDGVPAADVAALLVAIRALKDAVPEVVSIAAGTNFSDRSRGHTHAFVARFATREALAVYVDHPAHKAFVATRFAPLLAPETPPTVVDFES